MAASEGAPAALVVSVGGVVGLMGVNAAGLGVCVNSIPQLSSRQEGVPVAFVVRRLLQAQSVDEAAAIVLAAPHATSQHYLLADPGRIRAFEASAEAVVELAPDPPDRVLHTNHPLAARHDEPAAHRPSSEARLRSLRTRLGHGRPAQAVIEAALCAFDDPAFPVCRLRSDEPGLVNFTTAAMVARIERDGGVRVRLAAGPPSLGGFADVDMPA